MILYPTFNFNGIVLPIIDKTDKLYLYLENNNDNRVLLNVVSSKINVFTNIKPHSCKVVNIGTFDINVQTKIFYLGHELFDFKCDEIKKDVLTQYSDFIIRKITGLSDISFDTKIIQNGFKLITKSDKPQYLFIKIIDKNTNVIIHEESFISQEFYTYEKIGVSNYEICVYNLNGEMIYNFC